MTDGALALRGGAHRRRMLWPPQRELLTWPSVACEFAPLIRATRPGTAGAAPRCAGRPTIQGHGLEGFTTSRPRASTLWAVATTRSWTPRVTQGGKDGDSRRGEGTESARQPTQMARSTLLKSLGLPLAQASTRLSSTEPSWIDAWRSARPPFAPSRGEAIKDLAFVD